MEKFPVLDIVIGLSLIYTFLSVLTSEFTRIVVRILQWRHKQLQRTILNLFGESVSIDDPNDIKETITGKIINSPEIASAIHDFKANGQWSVLCGVSPQLFTKVLLDVLQNLPQSHPCAVADPKVAEEPIARLSCLIESGSDLPFRLQANLARMIHQAQRIESDPEQQFLRLQNEIAFWFSCALKEPAKTYKLHLKIVSFLISLGVVITANIDSLYIIRRISENTATRAVVMQEASHIQGCQQQLNSPHCAERLSLLMERTIIPISWHPANRRNQFAQLDRVVIIRTIGGWLFSSLAIAMGARFWLQVFSQLGTLFGKKSKPQKHSQEYQHQYREINF